MTADDVGGLNISWYNQSPLSDYWYATEFDECGEADDMGDCNFFFICDFWADDYLVQVDPWYCPGVGSPNADAADFGFGPIYSPNDEVIVVCNLGQECAVSGEIPLWFCLP